MTSVLLIALAILNGIVLVYFVLLNGVYLGTSFIAWRSLRQYARRLKTIDVDDLIRGEAAPPITLIVPAYNEEATCVESMRSLLMLRYPDYEITLVNDGSVDGTLPLLTEAFDLVPAPRAPLAELPHKPVHGMWRSRRHPNFWVIDKDNGGRADAINAGLCYCDTPFFGALDADGLLDPHALSRVVRPFLEDASVVAVGGIVRIANDCIVRDGELTTVRMPANLLARFQVLEYLRAFLAGRVGWSSLNAMLIVSGAFGLFRRETVIAVGGFWTSTVGEDMELTIRLHRYCREQGIPYAIRFVPDPVAWTQCPESTRVLGRQRDRWQRGHMETMWRHRHMLFNPRYGTVGLLAFPYLFCLEMPGSTIEGAGYIGFGLAIIFGQVSLVYALAFFLLAFMFGTALSLAAIGLEELTFRRYPRFKDLARLMLLSFLEPFGYRQLTVWWRTRGLIHMLSGAKGWGAITARQRFATEGRR